MKRNGFKCVKMPVTRSYLLPCDGGYLLIDTAYKGDYEKFVRSLEKQGVKPADIKYILLTHHHDDHAGLVVQLAKVSGARIIASEKGIEPLGKGENILGPARMTLRAKPLFALLKLMGGMSSFPLVTLGDGDVILSGDDDRFLRSIGIDGKILATPGHTRDSISILLDDGNAFVGDLIFTSMKLAGIECRHVYVDSDDDLLASWRKVLDGGAKTLYPVHGKPISADSLKAYMAKP